MPTDLCVCGIEQDGYYSSLNFFDDSAVLMRSILWRLSVASMFCNYNVSRDGSSLETL
jgi:hypothetical protein